MGEAHGPTMRAVRCLTTAFHALMLCDEEGTDFHRLGHAVGARRARNILTFKHRQHLFTRKVDGAIFIAVPVTFGRVCTCTVAIENTLTAKEQRSNRE